jgi:hypothetical protein
MNMFITKRAGILSVAVLLTVAGAGVAAGQRRDRGEKRWGSEATPRAGACFFQDSNFRGQYFCVDANDDLGKLPREMRDRISSVRVIGNVGVVVFRDEKFRGASAHFLTDVRDLGKQGWNDQISSIRVTTTASAWDGGRFPAWGRERTPQEGACFYRDIDFKGDYFCVPRGGSYAAMPPEFNDAISSIRVIRAGGVLIFGDRDFEGRAAPLTSSVADLRRGVWNDRISSIRVF